ncbi:MAG: hypothetical protein GXN98_01680 [Euryarchaeota archaeon]|nr:hypothetical protein [Euryarchaeota archaeon]
MDEKKALLLEILRELGSAKLARIQEVVEAKRMAQPEKYSALTGCNLHELLAEMAEEGLVEKQVPEWGAPVYRAKL